MSSYSEGQVHQLMDALEGSWYTAAHLTQIGQNPTLRREILGVLNGNYKVVPVDFIVRTAKVNRSRSQQAAIDATGRAQYTDRRAVDAMPKGEGDEVQVVFFKLDLSNRSNSISDDDLEKEFDLRGLKPADPISVAAVNEADPTFADVNPHGTHWKDAKGNWCIAMFGRWRGGGSVYVERNGYDWYENWWFAGVRK